MRSPDTAAETTLAQATSAVAAGNGDLQVYLLLILPPLFWGSNMVIGRFLAHDIAPSTLTLLRWVAATIVVLPLAFRDLRRDWPVILRRWPLLLLYTVTGGATFNYLMYEALLYTTAVNAALLASTQSIVMLGVGWAMLAERIDRSQLLGAAVAMIGVAVIVVRGDSSILLGLRPNLGDILVLGAGAIWSFYSVLLRRNPPGVSHLSFMAFAAVGSMTILLPIFWLLAGPEALAAVTPTQIGIVIYLGICPSIVATILWINAIAKIGPARTGYFNYLIPVFGSLMAILSLGERFEWFHAVGAAMIFVGIYVAVLRARPAVAAAAAD